MRRERRDKVRDEGDREGEEWKKSWSEVGTEGHRQGEVEEERKKKEGTERRRKEAIGRSNRKKGGWVWGAEEGTVVAGCSVGYWRVSKEQGEMEGSIVSCRIISYRAGRYLVVSCRHLFQLILMIGLLISIYRISSHLPDSSFIVIVIFDFIVFFDFNVIRILILKDQTLDTWNA